MNAREFVILMEFGKPIEAEQLYPVYEDSLGYKTIGPGILVDQRRGGGLTGTEVNYILDNRFNRLISSLARHYDWFAALDDVRKAVVVSMAYQDSQYNLLDDWPNFINKMALRDYFGAAAAMLDSKVAREQAKHRFQIQAEMMRTGQWPR